MRAAREATTGEPLGRRGRPFRVTVVYKSLPRYRIPFFEAVRPFLATRGCEFRLIYGQPSEEERQKGDTGTIEWADRVESRILRVRRRELNWQPCLRRLQGSDLVVVEQASKLLLNYALLACQHLGGPRVVFWGHGANFQSRSASATGEWLKRVISRLPHWWFAYTESSAAVVRRLGYPAERITIIQNAIDTVGLAAARRRSDPAALRRLRMDLGLRGENVAIFAGGLYPAKRPDYLIEAARLIRARIPDFELLVVGAGSEDHVVRAAAEMDPWIHWVGPRFEEAKVPYFLLAKVQLLPAAVGLAVLDSFALEVPLVTVANEGHGPELAYLEDGRSGAILPAGSGPEAYAERVVALLRSDEERSRLQSSCRQAAGRYTLEEMVRRFAAGVQAALAAETPQKRTVGFPKAEAGSS